jgi:hypothetical protein
MRIIRDQILRALLDSPKDGMCVHEISAEIGAAPLVLVAELVILERLGHLKSALVDWGPYNKPQRRVYHVVRSRVRMKRSKQ